MKRTLQDQYLLIKEGKGHKDVFIKEAKTQFPGLIRNAATFNEIATVLKDKNIINENIVGLEPINQLPGTKKESYEIAFENFLKEAKDTYFEDEKAEVKKTSKQVEDDLSHNFDRADKSNPDNMIFDQIMKGYYTEMKDPKNADKTMEQLKAIVLKNLEKNPIYYTEKGQFGVKDLGYTTEAPGLGTPKEAKGKYKASGYGDLKESIGRNYPGELEGEYEGELQKIYGVDIYDTLKDVLDISDSEDDFIRKMTNSLTDETSILPKSSKDSGVYLLFKDNKLENIMFTDGMKPDDKLANSLKSSGYEVLFTSDSRFSTPNSISKYKNKNKEELELTKSRPSTEEKLRTWYQSNYKNLNEFDINESKLRKVIRESIEKELATINKEAEMEILDSKLEKIQSAIEKRQSQLTKLDEDEDMKALTDKTKVKQIQKDIKALEKAKSKIEKQLSKKDKPAKSEIIDEDEVLNEIDPKGTESASKFSKEIDNNFKSIKSTVDSIDLEENEEAPTDYLEDKDYAAAEDKYKERIAQGDSNDVAAKKVAGNDKDLYNHLVGYSPDMDSDY